MKKKLLLMAMAGVALAGCVSEDVAEVKQKDEKVKVMFQSPVTYASNESRANVYGEIISYTYDGEDEKYEGTYSYPRNEKFIVFAKKYSGSFITWEQATNFWDTNIESIEVEYDEEYNGWSAGDDYVWPTNEKLAFAAYSPSDLKPYKETKTVEDNAVAPVVKYTNNGLQIEDFKVSDNPEFQFDLLYSPRTIDHTANYGGSDGKYNGVPIVFKHALSSIHFSVQKPASFSAEIILKSIKVKSVATTGTFNEVFDKDSCYWNIPESVTKKEYTAYNAGTETNQAVKFTGIPTHVAEASEEIAGDEAHALLLIPQALVDDKGASLVSLEITYTVGDETRTKTVNLGNQEGYDDNQKLVTVNKWEPGRRYIYLLRYAAGMSDVIHFAPETNSWNDVDLIIDLQ